MIETAGASVVAAAAAAAPVFLELGSLLLLPMTGTVFFFLFFFAIGYKVPITRIKVRVQLDSLNVTAVLFFFVLWPAWAETFSEPRS